MGTYSDVQFLNWDLYTGPVYKMRNGNLAACDYSGIRSSEQERRLDVLSQCLDISARVYFTKQAIQMARCQADPSSSVLKIFVLPEFAYRGAAGAYLHDLLGGWMGPAPFPDLPAPYDKNWPGLFGELRALAAQEEYKDWVFVFGTAVSAAFETDKGKILFSRPAECYNSCLIQRGGKEQEHKDQTHITRKLLKSNIDFIQFSESTASVFLDQEVWQEGCDPNSAAATAALLVCRMIEPEIPGEEGSARFSLPELCRKDGDELRFGVEICLDHALTCPLNITNEVCTYCTRSGRLNMTGPAVDLQIVPSCGMSLNPAALCLAKTQSGSCGYAFNCDGLGILGGGLGCHSQFWTNREESGQTELVRLDERSQQLNVRVDATAELPVASGSVPDELVAQATAFHLWNSRPADETSGDLINWPRGAGSITASAVQPL